MDGPLQSLEPDEVDKSFTTSSRAMAKALKTFKDSPVGTIAKAIKAACLSIILAELGRLWQRLKSFRGAKKRINII